MSEINEFEQHLKSAKNKFQLSTGLNLETLNTILSETNNIWAAAQIQPQAWKNENLAMKTQVFFHHFDTFITFFVAQTFVYFFHKN